MYMYINWYVLYVLVTGSCTCSRTYSTYQLMYIHSEYLLMMGNTYPKHVEVKRQNKSTINSTSGWFHYKSTCTASKTLKQKKVYGNNYFIIQYYVKLCPLSYIWLIQHFNNWLFFHPVNEWLNTGIFCVMLFKRQAGHCNNNCLNSRAILKNAAYIKYMTARIEQLH
jgi:hypothetical protein